MSEEKLTVAELMARAAKEGRTSDAPRSRRRRRSLEEGGVSVAELTGSIPTVKDKPVESRHSSVPIDEPISQPPAKAPNAAPTEPVTPLASTPEVGKPVVKAVVSESERHVPSDDETMVISIVDEKDPIRLTTGAFPVVPAVAMEPQQASTPAPEHEDIVEAAALAEFADADVDKHETFKEEMDVAPEEDEGKTSILSIVVMAVLGVILGVLVFLGFQLLWERLDKWIVSVLAIVVTVGAVAVIHAVRTSKDGFSMVLAAIVGLVMTFGPLATVI